MINKGLILLTLIISIILLYITLYVLSYKIYKTKKKIDLNNVPKYLINLDRRTDRLKITNKLLKQWGYNDVIRYSAIDGRKITNDNLQRLVDKKSLLPIYKKKRTEHHELSLGAVGCYLSHTNLWNEIEKGDSDYAVIFEDDTKPTLTQEELNDILAECPSDWDVILFGGYYNLKNNFSNDKFYKVNQFFCLHAYMINKDTIRKIKSELHPIKIQIDWVLSNLSNNNKLNIYAIKNSKWHQNTHINSTDIQTPVIVN